MRRVATSGRVLWMNLGMVHKVDLKVVTQLTKDLVLQKGDNQITKDQALKQKRDQKLQIMIKQKDNRIFKT